MRNLFPTLIARLAAKASAQALAPAISIALALVLSACANSGGSGGSGGNAAPFNIVYSQNPALYIIGVPITPNQISSGEPIQSFQISPTTLPAGLSFNSSNGEITGTPTAITASQTFQITGSNSHGSNFVDVEITVGDVPPTMTYGGSETLTFVNGTPISTITPTLGGGATVSCSSSPPLPSGLSLSNQCVISGTPNAVAASANYVVTATNTGGSASLTFNLTVDSIPIVSYPASPYTFTKGSAITPISITNSGGAIVSCAVAPALPAGLTLSPTTCGITGNPSVVAAAANYTVSATNPQGTATATINITVKDVPAVVSYPSSPYTFTRGTAISAISITNTGGSIVSCSVAPALPAGLTLSATCGITGNPSVISAAANYTVSATNTGGTATAVINITVNDITPVVNYPGSPYTFTKGTAIGAITINNTGGPIVSCAVAPSLPAGLTLSATCGITGTPTAVTAAANYTVSATNTGGTGTAVINIKVNDITPVISYVGSPYTYTKNTAITALTVNNTGGPIVSCAVAPALPAGLTLSTTTCGISGTPTAITAAANYTVSATNTGGTGTAIINIKVNDIPVANTYTGTPFIFNKSVSVGTITPVNTGGAPVTCSIAPAIPAGLAISNACVITGTPTGFQAATAYVVSATNTGGTTTANISIQINNTPPAITYGTYYYTYTKGTAITALTPANGGGAIVSCAMSPTAPAGLALSAACTLSGTPTGIIPQTAFVVTATNTGGTSSQTIYITINDIVPTLNYAGSPYTFTTGTSVGTLTPTNTGGTITACSSSPSLPAGLSLSTACVITGTPTVASAASNYTITASNTGGTVTANVNIKVNSAAPVISYAGSPFTFTQNSAAGNNLATNTGGAPTTCSAAPALPAGLSVANTTCTLSGTPTALAANATYTITATNGGGSGTATIQIAVLASPPAINYIPTSYNFTYTNGTAISTLTPNDTGGAIVTCAISPSAPAGLTFSTTTCALSGTPSGVQPQTAYTVTATNTGGTSSATIYITVNDMAPSITYSGSPFSYTLGQAITALTPTNSGGTITSCGVSPALPSGLSLSPLCVLSGTPSAVTAATNYTITATNSGGTSSATINIAVPDSAPSLTYAGGPYSYPVNTAITPLTPTNSGGSVISCASSPALPAGLTLSATCGISGTPTVVSGSTPYVITATNSGGNANATIHIAVTDAIPAFSYSPSSATLSVNTAASSMPPVNTGGVITSCASSPTLPAGLNLGSDCTISGTPTAIAPNTTYTITGTNGLGNGTASVTLTVNDQAPSISYPVEVFTLRTPITTVVPSSSGGTPTSCSPSPALPAGLTLAANCNLSGTPTVTAASANYTITATNSGGTTTTTLTLRVKDLPEILFSSYTALNGSWNGTAPSSSNIWKITSDGGSRVALTNNSNGSLDSFVPTFSSDGSQILFSSKTAQSGSWNGSTSNSFDLWSMSGTGTSLTALTSNSNAGLNIDTTAAPVLSPDGTRIAFASKADISGSPNGSGSSSYNIFVYTVSGGSVLAVTQNTAAGYDSYAPAFSPDSQTIYFYSKSDVSGGWNGSASNSFNIFSVKYDGTGLNALTSNTAAGLDSENPFVSPDGLVIVFQSKAKIGATTPSSFNIWTTDPTGSSLSSLTTNTAASLNSQNPRFSPDQSEIVFESMMKVSGVTSSSFNIWTMTPSGSSQTPLTTNTAAGLNSTRAIYAPDNSKIAFQSTMDIGGVTTSDSNIWIMNTDGSGQTNLTANTAAGLNSQLPAQNAWYIAP